MSTLFTVWCVIVVLAGTIAAGAPVRWLLNRRAPLNSTAWIEAPFFGVAAVTLTLQNLVYLDVPVQISTWVVWTLVLGLWVLMARAGCIRPSLAAFPAATFAVALGAYLLHGAGLLIAGARIYAGRAWGDQFNYTAIAQFFVERPYSTGWNDAALQPFLIGALRFKRDRIGQSLLQGFFGTTALTDARPLFEPAILLSPFLIALAIYAVCRQYRLRPRAALGTAFCAAALPAVALVHLEGFLSQALATPLLLLCPVLIDDAAHAPNWRRMLAAAVLMAAVAAIYTEFFLIVIVLAAGGLLLPKAEPPWRIRLLWFVGAVLGTLALNINYIGNLFELLGRLDAPVLGHLYPWALTVEGLVRLWLGDLGAQATDAARVWARACSLTLTGLGYYGLIRAVEMRLTRSRDTSESGFVSSAGFPVMVLATAFLPVIVFSRDDEHPYQFYKLLLTVAPLLMVGFAVSGARLRGRSSPATSVRERTYAVVATILTVVLWSTTLALTVAGTADMVVGSAGERGNPRSNAHLMLDPDIAAMERQLSRLRNRSIVASLSDDTWSAGLLNAWFTYFARHNQVWLANAWINDVDIRSVPEMKAVLEPDYFPPDVLLMTGPATLMRRVVSRAATELWTGNRYALWRPEEPWVYPVEVENPNGVDGDAQSPTYWLGGGPTRFRLFSSTAGTLHIVAQVLTAPHLKQTTHPLRIRNGEAAPVTTTITDGFDAIRIPVHAGFNDIAIEPLEDAPRNVPHTDGRPVLVALRDPSAVLGDDWAELLTIENPNGLETVQGSPFFWMGADRTQLHVLSNSDGIVRINAQVIPGPSIEGDILRRIVLTTDEGLTQTLATRGGELAFEIPLGQGSHFITLAATDRPNRRLAHDPRTLIVGLKNLSVTRVRDRSRGRYATERR